MTMTTTQPLRVYYVHRAPFRLLQRQCAQTVRLGAGQMTQTLRHAKTVQSVTMLRRGSQNVTYAIVVRWTRMLLQLRRALCVPLVSTRDRLPQHALTVQLGTTTTTQIQQRRAMATRSTAMRATLPTQ